MGASSAEVRSFSSPPQMIRVDTSPDKKSLLFEAVPKTFGLKQRLPAIAEKVTALTSNLINLPKSNSNTGHGHGHRSKFLKLNEKSPFAIMEKARLKRLKKAKARLHKVGQNLRGPLSCSALVGPGVGLLSPDVSS